MSVGLGVRTLTFGCRLNAHESDAMRGLAEAAGQDAHAIIVNTCAVTGEAEAQARQAIRKAARDDPAARIFVTGCAAQIAPEAWAGLPGVVRVIGNADKLRPEAWAPGAPQAPVSDIMRAAPAPAVPVTQNSNRARALVQVQQGCDHRCTFCVIPYGRGPSRSVPLGLLVEQVRALVAQGFREVVLTGVDIASYGPDLPGRPSLGQMLRRLLALVPELPRLRLSSLDPAHLGAAHLGAGGGDADLWRLIAEEPRLMPHLHLSLQHGSDLILKRMKRRHGRADTLALACRARALRPDIALGADLIAGFPTETEAQFTEMLDLVEEAGLSFLHVFPFSARPATPAARMPQVPVPLRRERAARLRLAGQAAAARLYASRVGRMKSVLLERGGRGHTEQFAPVRLTDARPGAEPMRPGSLRALRVLAADTEGLIAEAA